MGTRTGRRRLKTLLGCGAFALLAGCGTGPAQAPAAPVATAPANEATAAPPAPPDPFGLVLPTPAGDSLRLGDYRGRLLLVHFWATWCRPCLRQMPALDSLRQRLGPDRFEVVGIAMDGQDAGAVSALAEGLGVAYPIARGDGQTADAFGGAYGLPTSFLFGPDGAFVRRFMGALPLADIEKEARRAARDG